tara:strand:- start:1335 stop:1679 length:345 start_codon:yes stop_codon:yes gene_type:complete
MNYKQKYLKYKQKYLEIKNKQINNIMTGGFKLYDDIDVENADLPQNIFIGDQLRYKNVYTKYNGKDNDEIQRLKQLNINGIVSDIKKDINQKLIVTIIANNGLTYTDYIWNFSH